MAAPSPPPHPAQAREIEKTSLRVWPAAKEFTLDGWLLRFGGGYTGRANSVYPLDPGELPLETKINWCQGAYKDAGLPCQFRISSLTDEADPLKLALAERGYRTDSPTRVERLELLPPVQGTVATPPEGWQLREGQPGAWLEHFRRMDGLAPELFEAQAALLERMPEPHAFGWLERDGRAVACGQVVVAGSEAGLFDIVTDEALRRQGLGQMVAEALLNWAAGQDAQSAFLQVETSNVPAREMYQKLGFRHLYDYHYWRAP